jgi:hypothetical protein
MSKRIVRKAGVGAPTISEENRRIEHNIDLLLKVYYKNTPKWKIQKFLDYCSQVRMALAHPLAFTMTKQFLRVAEIPNKIFHMMAVTFDNNEWRNDPKIMKPFLRRVSKFRINTTTQPDLIPDKLNDDNLKSGNLQVEPQE